MLREMGKATLDLQFDFMRRFRNALLCLALSDGRWMVWAEENLPRRVDDVDRTTLMLVEAAARLRVLRGYRYFGREHIGALVFREDWAFTDRGSLSPG